MSFPSQNLRDRQRDIDQLRTVAFYMLAPWHGYETRLHCDKLTLVSLRNLYARVQL